MCPAETGGSESPARALWLVCTAHFFSHFYLILLAPLFPQLAVRLGVGYTELGFALTVFSLLSGFTQAPMGVLVDRYGAVGLLVAGIAVQGVAFATMGLATNYWMFVVLLGVAGVANSVYHPADYSILNRIISADRMGRAFSYHTASGLLGEALAPLSILVIAAWLHWQWALFVCGVAGVAVAIALVSNASSLASPTVAQTDEGTNIGAPPSWRFLITAPLLMGLLFFVGISLFTRGVSSFSVSAMHVGHGMSLALAGTILSAWLFSAPLGVLVGGRIADRHQRQNKSAGAGHASFVAGCLTVIAFCVGAVALLAPNVYVCTVAFAIGGFCAGAIAPSRDMLIRSIAPVGQTGTVFGFVSTGFNIGGIVAPPLFGYLLDRGLANGVFLFAALASLLTVFTVLGTHRASQLNKHAVGVRGSVR